MSSIAVDVLEVRALAVLAHEWQTSSCGPALSAQCLCIVCGGFQLGLLWLLYITLSDTFVETSMRPTCR